MGILEELESKRTSTERLDDWLATQPKQDREEWAQAFADRDRYSNGALARLLNAKGFPADDNLVSRYRKKRNNVAR